jgi:hypothetical protein
MTPMVQFMKERIGKLDLITIKHLYQAPVTHACNPSYSGHRDQEDHNSKPAPGK